MGFEVTSGTPALVRFDGANDLSNNSRLERVFDQLIEEDTLVSSFSVPVEPLSSFIIRDRISMLISDLPLTDIEMSDVRLAVGEATSNAVKFAQDGQCITVRCAADSEALTIEISDDGPGFNLDDVKPPDIDSLPTGGMGISIMRSIMDEVDFEFGSGTTVRMTKRLRSGS